MSAGDREPVTLTLPEALLEQIARRAAELTLLQLEHGGHRNQSPYLSITEAAELLRCKRQRIDDLLSRKRLHRIKEGRRTLILRAELEAYLAACGRHPAQESPHNSRIGTGPETELSLSPEKATRRGS